jgi:hypothetical protein
MGSYLKGGEGASSTEGSRSATTFSVEAGLPILDDERRPMTAAELRSRLDTIEHKAERARIERPGLYFMVFILLLKGCVM